MKHYSQYSVDVVAFIEGYASFDGTVLHANQATTTLEAYLVELQVEAAKNISNGAINISTAARISAESFHIRQAQEPQHLHFSLEGDGSFSHDVSNVYLIVECNSTVPVGIELQVHDLGFTGPIQEGIAVAILILVFAIIISEIVHHTLAAMFGSYIVLCVLAIQHRMPTISEAVMWMDHGTLALLWGMMVIVGVTAKTGIFEYCAVRLYKQSGGHPFRLLVLICCLDLFLSAFLDNVTTILLLAPVCVQLCDAVHRDPCVPSNTCY